MSAELAEEIVLGHELLLKQGTDGGSLLRAAGFDRLDDGVFVAKARLEGEALQQLGGHAGNILI